MFVGSVPAYGGEVSASGWCCNQVACTKQFVVGEVSAGDCSGVVSNFGGGGVVFVWGWCGACLYLWLCGVCLYLG